ncbi:MAG TPA: protein-glutamate O-methyltransferase CheR [Candidatus Saccharimonadia bacterium]|nr:protein-glutamate O-methyltransferase CheR [Candidatus Saccharimonadia bacterium]
MVAVAKFPQQIAPAMDDREFSRWVDLLERRTGVVVPQDRKTFLVTGVRSRMRETGFAAYADYFQQLLSGPRGAIEWATLVDRLTVHQTHFFRHLPSLDLVSREWLPEYVEREPRGAIHAWSIGCSTGEEAYSLAMVLDDAIARAGAPKLYFGITATDISAPALAVGRGGVYPLPKLEEIPEPYRTRYCIADGGEAFAIAETLRKRVGFVQFNLMDVARSPLKRLDLVFCQNVLIYFSRERRVVLLEALAELLKPGGLLVLGPGEVIGFTHPTLERMGGPQTLAFRRKR